MKIGDEVFVHGYVDEIRKDVIIIRNDGGYFGTVRSEIGSEIALKTDKDSELDTINNELDDAYARIRELTADTPQWDTTPIKVGSGMIDSSGKTDCSLK